jgi:hypothetical protein
MKVIDDKKNRPQSVNRNNLTNGLTSLVANESLSLRDSSLKIGRIYSMFLNEKPSIGIQTKPSSLMYCVW